MTLDGTMRKTNKERMREWLANVRIIPKLSHSGVVSRFGQRIVSKILFETLYQKLKGTEWV